MKAVLLDMVWPAIYVSETFWRVWFLVIGTIVIETFVIKHFLKYSWSKSFIVSLIGNCVSGFVGTGVMMYAMLVWHMLVDGFLPHATFDIVNWIATYFLMCLGSVFLETLTIKLLFKEKIKRLFLPMLTGNFLSYLFIAFVMISKTDVKALTLKYVPNKQQFILLDSSKLQLDTAIMTISFDKDSNKSCDMNIPFRKQNENSFQFNLTVTGDASDAGIGELSKHFHFAKFKETYEVELEQKNPDTSLGWKQPIVTDTLIFKQVGTP